MSEIDWKHLCDLSSQENGALRAALEKAQEWRERVINLSAKDSHDIEQTLGKVLGYPWYKDDQKNFPGANEAEGVCVGEHVPASIAAEAASRITALIAERDSARALLREAETLLRRTISVPHLRARIAAELEK